MKNTRNIEGMARFGINPKNTLGITTPVLRSLAKKAGTDHGLALRLWRSGIHEARVLAAFIADPACLTEIQMENWVSEFDSWDVCDQACNSLFLRHPLAIKKAFEWAGRKREFEKRAGFVMMAVLAWHSDLPDREIRKFLPVIKKHSADGRNFVIKAVNWALRNIGKRNLALNASAVRTARAMENTGAKPAVWAARDALRELRSDKVLKGLKDKETKRPSD
jgi:3-methyladenine DNA glycosylase AlkD